MIKKRYLILITLIICIILSFSNVVYSASWVEISQDPYAKQYSGCYETYTEAVSKSLEFLIAWGFVQSHGKDVNGNGSYDREDISDSAPQMSVGETVIYRYNDSNTGTQINSGGDLFEISVQRMENTTKSAGLFGGTKEVEQYKPTVTMVKEDSAITEEQYAESYREFIQKINNELGTNIRLPENDEQLADGTVVKIERQRSKTNGQLYDITIKANEKTDGALGITYIAYSYEYENITQSAINSQSPSTNINTTTTDLLEDLEDYKPGGVGNEEAFSKKIGVILGALNIVGAIISVITLMLIGFRYMFGSVEEKASYKKVMIPWVIGAFLVFTVTTIPNILFNIGTSITNNQGEQTTQQQPIDPIDSIKQPIYFN